MRRPRHRYPKRHSPFGEDRERPQYGRNRHHRASFQNFSPPIQHPVEDDGRDGRTYFYIYVKPRTPDERPVFDGPHMTETQAYDYAYANMPDKPFRVVTSPYKDPARATQNLKHTRLTEEGIRLRDALMPVKHKI